MSGTEKVLKIETECPLRDEGKDVLGELGVRGRPVLIFFPEMRELYAGNLNSEDQARLMGEDWVRNISEDGSIVKTREIQDMIKFSSGSVKI